jgi:hypothetical protein
VTKRKVLYRKVAQQDLAEAYDWYHSIDPALAEKIVGRFEARSRQDRRATAELPRLPFNHQTSPPESVPVLRLLPA